MIVISAKYGDILRSVYYTDRKRTIEVRRVMGHTHASAFEGTHIIAVLDMPVAVFGGQAVGHSIANA